MKPVNKYVIGVAVLIAIGVARIAATYTVFNGTYDEPFHIANGMEWLQQGTFTNQYRHPPLAGIVSALGPFIHGLRSPRRWKPAEQGESVIFEEGNEILYAKNDYWLSLTLARIGTLPFFVLACVVTFLWSRRWFCKGFSETAGFWAVLLLVCTSPILGHAGLATNDVACAAGAAFALYRFRTLAGTTGYRAMAVVGICDRIRDPVQVFEHPVSRRLLCGWVRDRIAGCISPARGAGRPRGMCGLLPDVGDVPIHFDPSRDNLRTASSHRRHPEQLAAPARRLERHHGDAAAADRSNAGRA